MSNDVFVQLRSYGDFFEGELPAIDLDNLAYPTLLVPKPTTRPRFGWIVSISAALVTVLVVGGLGVSNIFSGGGLDVNVVDVHEQWEGRVWVDEGDGAVSPRGDRFEIYVHAGVRVFERWGSAEIPESRPYLHYLTDVPAESGEQATIEMVWLSWQGIDTEFAEIQAALEHTVTSGLALHPECHLSQSSEFAVAVIAADLEPVAAWKVGSDYATFENVEPSLVQCESVITRGMTRP